jgi:hypothetical protein
LRMNPIHLVSLSFFSDFNSLRLTIRSASRLFSHPGFPSTAGRRGAPLRRQGAFYHEPDWNAMRNVRPYGRPAPAPPPVTFPRDPASISNRPSQPEATRSDGAAIGKLKSFLPDIQSLIRGTSIGILEQSSPVLCGESTGCRKSPIVISEAPWRNLH